MTNPYQNIFTNKLMFDPNIHTNFNNFPDNSKFWVSMTNASQKNGMFFRIKTFNDVDTQIIQNALTNLVSGTVFFDTHGNLRILVNNNIALNYKNPLNKFELTANQDSDIFSTTSNTLELVLSKNRYWILYFRDGKFHILYNPMHREPIKKFYKALFNDNGQPVGQLGVGDILSKYCDLVKSPNQNDITQFADKTCDCYTASCIDNTVGFNITSSEYKSSIGDKCLCLNPACSANDYPLTSFAYNDNTSFLTRLKEYIFPSGCPTRNSVICNNNIYNEDTTNPKVQNVLIECNMEIPTQAPITQPPTSAPTAAPETQPPETQPPTIAPTLAPETQPPTFAPETQAPTIPPTFAPETQPPTFAPETPPPTIPPTFAPETQAPTFAPTFAPETQTQNTSYQQTNTNANTNTNTNTNADANADTNTNINTKPAEPNFTVWIIVGLVAFLLVILGLIFANKYK